MRFKLSLKSTHEAIIDDLKEKYSISSNEEVVIRSVKSAFQLENNDLIFATEREQCVGGCFGADPCFDIEIDDPGAPVETPFAVGAYAGGTGGVGGA